MHEEKIAGMIPSLTWEGVIRDIVKKENMDPWDIDISQLTTKFFDSLSDKDIKLYGKLFLTASLLLRMKSDVMDEGYEYYLADLAGAIDLKEVFEMPDVKIFPKLTPSRRRKVTIDDLMMALRKAMEVEERRNMRKNEREKSLRIREMFKSIDLEEKMRGLYSRIVEFFKKLGKERISFVEVTQSNERTDIIWTFIPLLHLASEGKLELFQDEPFGEIYVEKAN
jgi:segregation and condensation protein A